MYKNTDFAIINKILSWTEQYYMLNYKWKYKPESPMIGRGRDKMKINAKKMNFDEVQKLPKLKAA